MTETYDHSAVSLALKVRQGQLGVGELAAHYASRLMGVGKNLNACVGFEPEFLAAEVARVEALLRNSKSKKTNLDSLPLAGLPILIKDNISVAGLEMTCSSRMLAGFRPCYDATAVARLKAAGALVLAKTNMDEFGMGSSSEFSIHGPVRNPWDLERVAGGSSGGSAAAVAAGLAPLALGSDTGGSIRQPASFCGVVGFKPSYGRVSRYGLTAYASSLDHLGPLAFSVLDAAALFAVIAGYDPLDSTSLPGKNFGPDLLDKVQSTSPEFFLKTCKVGVLQDYLLEESIHSDVRSCVLAAADKLSRCGAQLEGLSLSSVKHSLAIYYILAMAEASSNLSRFTGVAYGKRHLEAGQTLQTMYAQSRREGFGPEVLNRVLTGTFILSAGYSEQFYEKATRAREQLRREFARLFASYDILLCPTAPTTAFKLGEKAADPLAMYWGDMCTTPANLLGCPAVSLPCGFDAKGLPVGLQLLARPGKDLELLQFAHAYQQSSDWHIRCARMRSYGN